MRNFICTNVIQTYDLLVSNRDNTISPTMLKFYQIDGRIAIGNIHFHALITKKRSRKISRLNFKQNTDDFLTGKRGWRGPGRGSLGGSGGPCKRSPGGGRNFKVQTVALEERASEEETATGAERVGSKAWANTIQNWPAIFTQSSRPACSPRSGPHFSTSYSKWLYSAWYCSFFAAELAHSSSSCGYIFLPTSYITR